MNYDQQWQEVGCDIGNSVGLRLSPHGSTEDIDLVKERHEGEEWIALCSQKLRQYEQALCKYFS